MSRISRYQGAVDKFLKTKSVISKNDIDNLDLIINNLTLCDHLTAILLLTVMNSQTKKKSGAHGFHMASGIDIMMFLSIITDKRKQYEEDFGRERYKNLCNELISFVFKSLAQNIETIKYNNKTDDNFRIYSSCIEYLNKKIYEISKCETILSNKKMVKNDVSTLKFNDKDIMKTKYSKLYKIDKDVITKYVESKYGAVAQCALVLGWLLGGGDEKTLENLEKMGTCFGYIIKLCYDFVNIENDIDSANRTTTNIIANIGVHESFALFVDNKTKFIEGCTALDIYTNSMKEVIDLIEEKIDVCLEKSNIDLKSTYSSFSSVKKTK